MDAHRLSAVIAVISVFMIAQIPFSLGAWMSSAPAPHESGFYDVIIRATYNGIVGTFPLELRVGDVSYPSDGLAIQPVYPLDKITPIDLKYDIRMNGSSDFSMVSNNLTLYYSSGDTILSSEESGLSLQNDSYWHATVDVPFRGEYKAVISIIVQKDGKLYGGKFLTYFKADGVSDKLLLSPSLDKKILTPMESFDVSMEATFKDYPIPALKIFKANLYGTLKVLSWDPRGQVYTSSFTAPSTEGIYVMSVYAEGQGSVSQERIYVADVSKAKSGRCPLASGSNCADMKDVRKCVSDYKGELIKVSEDKLAQCFEAASGGITTGSIICNGRQMGDLNGNGQLDIDDVDVLQNLILPLTQSMRQEYSKCADYDHNNKVDEQDLKCLSNVVAGKWYGDLNGGICFDAVYDSALKCDLTGDKFIRQDDTKILEKLVSLASTGISMPRVILNTCDFDQNTRITKDDNNCLEYFVGMDLDRPETLLGGGQTIPANCMKIYTLDKCQGILGDVNGDLRIDEVDEILEMLVEKRQIADYNRACADVNKDGRITTEDVMCVKSYTAGDRNQYFICIGCDENTPPQYRAPVEICNDGYDNDCDGLIDRTSLDPNQDECRCIEGTSCWMIQDATGGADRNALDTGKMKVCRKMDWATQNATGGSTTGMYQWVEPSSLICGKDKECQSMYCAGKTFTCANNGAKWKWYDIGEEKLPTETDDPKATPRTCDDSFDNDCQSGDIACKKPSLGDMFSTWQFWVGIIVGAVCGFLLGPATMLVLGLLMSGLNMVVKSPAFAAFSFGFGIGALGGGLTQMAANAGMLGAKMGELAGSINPVGNALSSVFGSGGTTVISGPDSLPGTLPPDMLPTYA